MFYVWTIAVIAFDIALAVHVARTGRPLTWIFIILFFPVAGGLVYLFAEIIPELERRNTIQYWVADVERFFSNLFK